MSDERILSVYMDRSKAGSLCLAKGGKLRFAYESAYAGAPLSLSLPLSSGGSDDDKWLKAFLWNVLPDDPRLIDRWARIFVAKRSSCFELLEAIGEDCPGNLRFLRPEREGEATEGGLDPISDEEIGRRLAFLESDPAAARLESDRGRFSLPGAQPKLALRRSEGRWYLPWGLEPTTHILKPPRSEYPGHAENEHFCLSLAEAVGLNVAKSEVLEFCGSKALCVARYDRFETAGGVARIHQEDMCQVLGIHPSDKYESDGGPGAADIATALSLTSKPELDKRNFLKAIVFNYLILGTDAHAKNYSILIGESTARLAPLYDICSFLPYVASRRDERFAMRIGRAYKDRQIGRPQFEKLAVSCGVRPEWIIGTLAAMSVRLENVMDQVAATRGINDDSMKFIERLAALIRRRVQDVTTE